MIGIYLITCLSDGKVYVGQTTNWDKRRKKHFWMLENNKHFCLHLQRAWNKYGKTNFKFELVEECSENELDAKETEWITKFGYPNRTKIFNNESGGHKNKHLSQETKDKISKFNKRKTIPEYQRQLIRESRLGSKNPMYGRHYTLEERQKMSERQKLVEVKQSSINALLESNKNLSCEIYQYDLNGNFIQSHPSIQEAARRTNSQASLIHKVLTGKRRKTNNYIWKYKKDVCD